MKQSLNFNGSLSYSIVIDNGVKQVDVPDRTLFSFFFVVTLTYVFQGRKVSVNLRFRAT